MTDIQLEPQYREAFDTWKRLPSPQSSGQLLKTVKPVINTALRTYGGTSFSPTLRTRAKKLSLEAFNSYDPHKGSMKTHLMSNLQRLRRIQAKSQQIISMPERVAMDRLRTDDAGLELEETLGRPPSDSELADFTGLSTKRLAHIRQAQQPVAEGTLMQPTADGAGMFSPASTIPGQTTGSDAWVEFVYGDLNPTDQFVMERAMGLHGHQTIPAQQIAKHLGITPGAISQRMSRIQQLLDQRDEFGVL
jgi:hypothetical protein